MRDYTFTLSGVTITVQARNFFEACGVAGTEFYRIGLDTRTAG